MWKNRDLKSITKSEAQKLKKIRPGTHYDIDHPRVKSLAERNIIADRVLRAQV
jgi:hypothetical protein